MFGFKQKHNILNKMIREQIQKKDRCEKLMSDNILTGSNVYVSDDSTIGSYSYIGDNVRIENAKIGRFVSIADNVTIAPGEHRISQISTSYKIYKERIGSAYYNGDSGRLEGGWKSAMMCG